MGKPRLTIRDAHYRGRPGYTVSGRDTAGRRVKLFTKTRCVAERLRVLVRDGHTITHADFLMDPNEEE